MQQPHDFDLLKISLFASVLKHIIFQQLKQKSIRWLELKIASKNYH